MSKKALHIMILFTLFPLAVGLACLSSRADPTATPRPVVETEVVEAPTSEPTIEVVAEETEEPTPTLSAPEVFVLLDNSLWVQDGSMVFAAFMVQNPSRDLLYEDVEFTVRLLDENGNLVDEDYQNILWFFPGQTVGLVTNYWLETEAEVMGGVEVEWTYAGTSPVGNLLNPMTYEDAVYWGNGGYPLVTGRVVNTDTITTFTDVRANVICFNEAGEVVGGGVTYVYFVQREAYMGFSAYVDTFGDVASVEVFPSLTFASQWIDKADFLSEIVIEDEYFYEDDLGYLQGGFIAKNVTEYVLRNSLVSINFYDENDHITATASAYIDLLLPGDAVGIVPWVTTPPEGVESKEFDFRLLPGEVDDAYELDANPFVINSITVTGDEDNYVLVNFTNQYSKTVSEVDVFVLVYNAAGEIIGGGKDWTKSATPSGGTSELEVWVTYDSAETVAVAEAWVVPSFFTSFE